MHTAPMKDSEGDFGGWNKSITPCRDCGQPKILWRMWESHCGGYEDYQYKCENCGKSWWVEGPDS